MVKILCADISKISEDRRRQLYMSASPERKRQADNCRMAEDALRCIVAGALLQLALQTVPGCQENLRILRTDLGKPYLEDHPDFHFSISHSGNWVALAFGRHPLGLDIQMIAEKQNTPALARRFFTEEEQAYLAEQPDYARAFTRIWTAKESYLKYLGTGLTKSLTSFSVLSPDLPVCFQWDALDECCLCLCSEETAYRQEFPEL